MFSNKNKIINLVCPVCGEEMNEYKYGYDNNVHGKIYFKCEHCGHKESIIFYHFFSIFYIKYYHREFNEGIYYYVL